MVKKIERIMKQKLPRERMENFDYETPKPAYSQAPKKNGNRNKQKSSTRR
jgi:hypothetical protein